ncbi:MAG: VanZ family protein [Acidobacteriaceae bacterium]
MRPVFFYKPLPPQPSEASWRWWFNVWTPAAIAVAIICVESSDLFSANHTSTWLRPILQRLIGPMKDSTWNIFHHYLRKTGHFVGYGLVAFTFLRAWLYTLTQRGPSTLIAWRLESSILAIFSTAIVASCDEYHQSFIPSRTSSPLDVLLDTAGACALCLLVWLLCWSKRQSGTKLNAA